MTIDWDEVERILSPIKGFEDLCLRWQESFSYSFVRETFNVSMPRLVVYTQLGVGSDPRGRYTDYAARLIQTMAMLEQAGVHDVLDLKARVQAREQLAGFAEQSGLRATDIAEVLKYLTYWFIPIKKSLSGLIGNDAQMRQALAVLAGLGIRSNLDLLQQGITPTGRRALAESSGLPETVITDLVNRADFSRMPWASKATIANIMGAGCASLAEFAEAEAEELYARFYAYGKSIGKNLKLGNEIENSHRIAKIVPRVLRQE